MMPDWLHLDDFPARWHCGVWPSWLGWMAVVGDALVFLAYVAIPFLLWRYASELRGVMRPRAIASFGAFILLCGIGHAWEVTIMWLPIYRLSVPWKLATAAVSLWSLYELALTARAIHASRAVERDHIAELEATVASMREAVAAARFVDLEPRSKRGETDAS